MRKTILFLIPTLLMLPVFGQNKPPRRTPPGKGNNDSPIVVSDTSTRTPKAPGTTLRRDNVTGKNHHFYPNVANQFTVHDKQNFGESGEKDNYRPLCLEFGPPMVPKNLQQLGGAKSWSVIFLAGKTVVLSMKWDDPTISGSKADVALTGNLTIDTAQTILQAGLQVTQMNWTITPGAGGSSSGSVTPPPPPVPNPPDGVPLLTVHYCPNGNCKGATNPCNQ